MIKNNMIQNNYNFNNFKKELRETFISIFVKFKKNKLILSIIYSFDLLTDKELKTFYNYYESSKNKNKNVLLIVILNSLLTYLSFKISYNFEHMLNNCLLNKKPSLHIIYGETISQLAAFCIGIESNNIVLNCKYINNEIKDKIIQNIFNLDLNNDLSFQNFHKINESNKKDILKEDLQHKLNKLLEITKKNISII